MAIPEDWSAPKPKSAQSLEPESTSDMVENRTECRRRRAFVRRADAERNHKRDDGRDTGIVVRAIRAKSSSSSHTPMGQLITAPK